MGIVAILVALGLGLGPAARACDPPAGRLVSAEATVEVRALGQGPWVRIQPPHVLCEGDQVAVRSPGRAAIVLGNEVLVRLDQDTTLNLTRVAREADSELGLARGVIHIITRFRKGFGVTTPFVNALVEGTEFTVASSADGARVVVAEGRVRAINPQGERALLAEEAIQAGPGAAPAAIQVRPLDAVRWAIHYPQIIWSEPAALEALAEPWRSAMAGAQEEMAAARYARALGILEALPDAPPPPQVEALRISLLLALGRVDAARQRLDGLGAGADAGARALDAVIRVARNDHAGALSAARQAVATDPASAAAQLALSYALQAQREVVQALEAARRATQLAPGNPFAWARQAELELSLARHAAGAAAAREALARHPAIPRARALLGFAELLQGRTEAALATFDAAIAGDSADPLARFGKGLAQVRRGELAAGRQELEIAVLLDPSNAELRSYLGRIYMEEDRARVAGSQFELARRLDPASPTPWHFDAFRKLRDNDPLGAMGDGARAIALNDNRAVFRSGALLDIDRAARNASLGSAYQQVGFDQSMLAAAMAALDDDPASPAGHRLLAEAYADTPRFETARVSEVFQAEVRRAIGELPAPPQFQARNLPVVEGPRALAPEEASALFDRRPSHFSASLLGGSQETWGDSLLAARSWERAQLALGHFDFRQDGFRNRDDISLTATQLAAQFAASPETMIYGEVSHSDRSGGDPLASPLEGMGLLPERRGQDVTTHRGRLTLRHAPDVSQELIVTAAAQDVEEQTFDRVEALFSDIHLRTRLQSREAGLLYGLRGASYGLLAGASTYHEARKESGELGLCCLPFTFPPTPLGEDHAKGEHNTAWAYLDLRPAPWSTLHLGLAHGILNGEGAGSVERLSWKSGLTLRLAPATTLRLGVFQGVKGPKYEEQTLEPTRFAGFNQLFDDLDATRWRRQAVGLDHRFPGGVTAGVEWSRRSLEVPGQGCLPEGCRADWSELLHQAHLAVPLGPSAAFSAAWRFESLRLNEDPASSPSLPYLTRTELLPLRLWLRLGPRLSAQFEALRVRQETAISDGFGGVANASPHFWLANARWSYTQPDQRLGLSLAIHNIFDRDFAFQNTDISGDPKVPLFYADRTVLVQAHVRF